MENFATSVIYPNRMSLIPMKLCQSAPPLNRHNLRQATLRPFTPRYNSLSARLRLTRHMPFRSVEQRDSSLFLLAHALQRCTVSTIVLYSMAIESDGSNRLVGNDQWMLEYRTMVSILLL